MDLFNLLRGDSERGLDRPLDSSAVDALFCSQELWAAIQADIVVVLRAALRDTVRGSARSCRQAQVCECIFHPPHAGSTRPGKTAMRGRHQSHMWDHCRAGSGTLAAESGHLRVLESL